MTTYSQPLDRQSLIKQIWQDNRWLYGVVGFLLGLLAFPFMQMVVTDIGNLLDGLVPETVGIVFTVVIIDSRIRAREEQKRERDLQEQLVRDTGSGVNDVALNAVHQLRRRGWLQGEDSLLQKANLSGANLQEADLHQANLKDINLDKAKLQRGVLWGADLQGANFLYTDLQDADLQSTNLQEVYLQGANLRGANLQHANLENTLLERANLQGACLAGVNLKGVKGLKTVVFDEATVLPDAEIIDEDDEGNPIFDIFWTSSVDMTRYINPDHPNFWQPKPNTKLLFASMLPKSVREEFADTNWAIDEVKEQDDAHHATDLMKEIELTTWLLDDDDDWLLDDIE